MSTLAFDPEETTRWEQIRPRKIEPEQWKKFEGLAALSRCCHSDLA